MKKKLNEAAPATTNIGAEYAAAKKQISDMLTKLGSAFTEYDGRMKRLNMALQRQMDPLAAGTSGMAKSLKQLEEDYAELQQTSQEALKQANSTIEDLKRQLKQAQSDAGLDSQRLMIANSEVGRMEQEISDKQQAISALLSRIDKAREKISGERRGREEDRQGYNKAMEAYEAQIEELRKANEDLQKTAEEAVNRFNELLGGTTRKLDKAPADKGTEVAHTKHTGGFNLREHLERAAKSQGVKRSWF